MRIYSRLLRRHVSSTKRPVDSVGNHHFRIAGGGRQGNCLQQAGAFPAKAVRGLPGGWDRTGCRRTLRPWSDVPPAEPPKASHTECSMQPAEPSAPRVNFVPRTPAMPLGIFTRYFDVSESFLTLAKMRPACKSSSVSLTVSAPVSETVSVSIFSVVPPDRRTTFCSTEGLATNHAAHRRVGRRRNPIGCRLGLGH
jgi:hypothetical protein